MSWEKVKLQDVTEYITDGDHQPAPKSDTGVLFVKIKDIFNNKVLFDNALFVPEEYYDQLPKNRKAMNGDTLYTVVGSYGIPAFVSHDTPFCFERNIALLHPNKKVIPKYLFYALKNPEFYQQANNIANGSAQKLIPLSKLAGMEIIIPNIDVQKRIVTILSAYDSLIENNQKQIKLLEEAAQRLYKEWFVDLRFPGHEDVKIVDGLPEGWENSTIGHIGCRLESGSRPKGGIDANLKIGVPSVGAENVIGLGKYNYSSEKFVSNEFYSNMKKGQIKDKDILIYKDGAYIGRTSLFQDSFPHKVATVNEHVFLLHMENEELQYYVFFTLYQKEYYDKMQKLNKNAAQPGINSKALLSLDIVIPNKGLIEKFNFIVQPIMKDLFVKAKQNRELSEARERLLPKLMSGEIEV